MWRRKLSSEEKAAGRTRYERRRLRRAPTRSELATVDDAVLYCRRRKLSARATTRVVNIVTGHDTRIDWRDHRTVAVADRVPRSLEAQATPQRFWEVTDPVLPVLS